MYILSIVFRDRYFYDTTMGIKYACETKNEEEIFS